MNIGAFVDAMFGLLGLLVLLFVVFVASIDKVVPKDRFLRLEIIENAEGDCFGTFDVLIVEESCNLSSKSCAVKRLAKAGLDDISAVPEADHYKNITIRYADSAAGEFNIVGIPAHLCSQDRNYAPTLKATMLNRLQVCSDVTLRDPCVIAL